MTNERTTGWKRILLRSVGFGMGIGLGLGVAGLCLAWYINRPKAWRSEMLTASKPEITAGVGSDNAVHVHYAYGLTNHTGREFTMPSTYSGALFRKSPEGDSLVKLNSATWDTSLRIPPGQTLTVAFNVDYPLADYNTTSAEISAGGESKGLIPFLTRRMNETNGLVFLDYVDNYRIELPRNWTLGR